MSNVHYAFYKENSSPKTVAIPDATPQSDLPELQTWFGSFIQNMRDVAAVLTALVLFLLIVGSVPLAFSLVMLCFK